MFLYLNDFFQKSLFHVLLIIFCSLLTLNSIMTLADLKNYEAVIDYSSNPTYYHILKSNGKTQVTFDRPLVKVKYKYANMPYKFTWANGQLLGKNLNLKSYTVEYKVYSGTSQRDLSDSFKITFKTFGYSDIAPIQKEYAHSVMAVSLSVVDYDIKFNARVYLPHAFVIAASLFFIIPSSVMIFKIKKEEK